MPFFRASRAKRLVPLPNVLNTKLIDESALKLDTRFLKSDEEMHRLAQNKLAFRLAGSAIIAIVVVATVISFIAILVMYGNERERLELTLQQQVDTVASAAARAAFHVDGIQAANILQGLFHFENLQSGRISTDLGETLAEKQRDIPSSFVDPLARYLFADIALNQAYLYAQVSTPDGSSNATRSETATSVGLIKLRTSPELMGQNFLDTIGTYVAALIFQFIILGLTLIVLFHRTLTLPLLNYAESISRFSTVGADEPLLQVPEGHLNDELGIVVVHTNQLVERIRSQHQAILHREKIAALGTLLATVSHELSNPLAILMAQSELLVETSEDAATKKRGEEILGVTKRCAVIVRRFLALSRRRENERKAINIGHTIIEALEILDHQLELASIDMTVSVPDDLPLILADPSQLTQVFLNIIINAQQALESMSTDRRISVRAEFVKVDAAIRISISDNGPGIAGDSRVQVFEPFYTTKLEGDGTGLGLSYSYKVLQDHRGSLKVSTSELGGATFVLTMPAIIEGDPKTLTRD
jgi:signal transduction histidine kinase